MRITFMIYRDFHLLLCVLLFQAVKTSFSNSLLSPFSLTVLHNFVLLPNLVTLLFTRFKSFLYVLNNVEHRTRTSLVDTSNCENWLLISSLDLLFKKVLIHTETFWVSSSCLCQCPLILFHVIGSTNLPDMTVWLAALQSYRSPWKPALHSISVSSQVLHLF